MENKTNIRGSMIAMEPGETIAFTYEETKPSYVRKVASEISLDTGRVYAVEAKRGSERIIVRRIQ